MLKVGDKVIIKRVTYGIPDSFVGKECVIVNITSNDVSVRIGDYGTWYVMEDSLKKIYDKKGNYENYV